MSVAGPDGAGKTTFALDYLPRVAGWRTFVNADLIVAGLVPNAPLLIDGFGSDTLADRVRGLPHASRLLEWERNRHRKGHIDIERLMTRLESLMPYDHAGY